MEWPLEKRLGTGALRIVHFKMCHSVSVLLKLHGCLVFYKYYILQEELEPVGEATSLQRSAKFCLFVCCFVSMRGTQLCSSTLMVVLILWAIPHHINTLLTVPPGVLLNLVSL